MPLVLPAPHLFPTTPFSETMLYRFDALISPRSASAQSIRNLICAGLTVACACLLLAVPAGAQDVTVDDDGEVGSSGGCDNTGTTVPSTIGDGISNATSGDVVFVCPGTYAENVTINKAITLNGNNDGTAGNGARAAESLVEAGNGIGFHVTTTASVEIDGFEFVGDEGVVLTGDGSSQGQVTVQNSRLLTNERGVVLKDFTAGSGVTVASNFVDLTQGTYTVSPSREQGSEVGTVGIELRTIDGAGSVSVSDNDFSDGGDAGSESAFYGVLFDGVKPNSRASISGGSIQGTAQAVAVLDGQEGRQLDISDQDGSDATGTQSPDESYFDISGVSASTFTGSSGNSAIDQHAGIFVYTGGNPSSQITSDGQISNAMITGTGTAGGDGSSSAGLYFGGFSTEYGNGNFDQTVTVTDATVQDNGNRGVYARGADVTATVTQSTITGNGGNSVGGSNPGFGLIARKGADLTVEQSEITNPASSNDFGSTLQSQQTLTVNSTDYLPILTVTDCRIDRNGLGDFFSGGEEARAAGNAWLDGTLITSGSTIAGHTSGASNDFNPFLTNGMDQEGGTPGFQGDFSEVNVTLSGDQLGSFGTDQRIADGINEVNSGGTVTVENGTFTENVVVNKSVTLEGNNAGTPGSGARSAETVVDAGTSTLADSAFAVRASNVTIDGFRLVGSQGAVLNGNNASNPTDWVGLTVQNNLVETHITGVSIQRLETTGSSSFTIQDNQFAIQQQEFVDPSNSGSEAGDQVGEETIAVFVSRLSGIDVPTIADNVITDDGDDDQNGVPDENPSGRDDGAFYGYVLRGAEVSDGPVTISGGAVSGTLQAIAILDGQIVEPSHFKVDGVTMNAFAGVGNNSAVNFHAGIFVYSAGSPGSTITTTGTVTGVTVEETDVPDTANDPGGFQPSAGLYFGGFSDQYGNGDARQDVTVTEATIRNNANRGIFARGLRATATVQRSTIQNNGADPASSTNPGFGVIARRGASVTVENSVVANPASQTNFSVDALQAQQPTGNNSDSPNTPPTLTVTDSKVDRNGNGAYATGNGTLAAEQIVWTDGGTTYTDGVDVVGPSGDYFENGDFTPFLMNATDQDTNTDGFQPDDTQLGVTKEGEQQDGTTRLQEGTDVASTNGGTISVDAGTYSVADLTVKSGITLETGADVSVANLLTLSSGTFDVSSGSLTLSSTSESEVGYIAGSGSGSVTGDVTIERYVDKGDDAAHFRFLSSPFPVYLDDAGAAGNSANLLSNVLTQATGNGANLSVAEENASVYTFDESVNVSDDQFSSLSEGWNDVENLNDAAITPGNGYLVYLFENNGGAGPNGFPVTFSVTGSVPSAENDGTDQAPALTFTDNDPDSGGDASPDDLDGWNLIANPFAAPIDWESIESSLSNVDATVYVLTADGTYAEYTAEAGGGTNGTSTNGGARYIAPFQAFFVKANGSSPDLSITSGDKAVGQAPAFKEAPVPSAKEDGSDSPRIVLELRTEDGSRSETTAVTFAEGAKAGKDAYDAYQLAPFASAYAQISTTMEGTDVLFAHQHRPVPSSKTTIGIAEDVTADGSYVLSAKALAGIPDDWSVILEDVSTGERYDLRAGEQVEFVHTRKADSTRATMERGTGSAAVSDVTPTVQTKASESPAYRLHVGTEAALPVELAEFHGRAKGKKAILSWKTLSETANAGFEVQRRGPDASAFRRVGYVEGHGTTTETHRYRFRVEELPVGDHTFRLRQVDTDGRATISDPTTLTVALQRHHVVRPVAPNPVRHRGTLKFATKEAAPVTVALYNALGQRVQVLYRGTPEAGTFIPVPVRTADLASGVYFVRVQGEDFVETKRVTVVQ